MHPDHRDPFFLYPRQCFTTSAGEVELPILYFDTSALAALFWVDMARAQSLLVGTGLRAIAARPGKALAAVAFYNYRETTVGAYNEVGVAIAVRPEALFDQPLPRVDLLWPLERRLTGYYIIDLPVTTAAANAAGRELWGFPKFITDIEIDWQGRDFAGRVRSPADSGDICSLSGRLGQGLLAPPLQLALYSQLQGRLLRSLVNVRGRATIALPGSLRLRTGTSQHDMAERLRALGLADVAPFAVHYTHAFQSRLNAGAPMP